MFFSWQYLNIFFLVSTSLELIFFLKTFIDGSIQKNGEKNFVFYKTALKDLTKSVQIRYKFSLMRINIKMVNICTLVNTLFYGIDQFIKSYGSFG